MREWPLYLGGEWRSDGVVWKDDVNPADDEPFAKVAFATPAHVDKAVEKARHAQKAWALAGPSEREAMLLRAADIFERRIDEVGASLVKEMGCTIGNGIYNVLHTVQDLRAKAGDCRRICGETIPSDVPGLLSMTIREPLGVVAAIAPFNFPLVLAMVKVSSALATGNAIILKPAETTPISGLLIAEIFEEAGLPTGLLSVLPGDGEVGSALVEHDGVDMVTFTGSTATGRRIAMQAAAKFKRVCLELGGKGPLLVLDDADLDDAVNAALFGGFGNQGQTCMASSRLIVQEGIFDAFVEKLTERTKKIKVGDPQDTSVALGPLISKAKAADVKSMVDRATAEGATLLCGGRHDGPFFEATLLKDVEPGAEIFQEELFAPVVAISRARDLDHAIELANATRFGLSAAVMTKNIDHALRAVREIKSGMVHVNATTMQCEPQAPFGGVKQSGIGRESTKSYIDEMTEVKWVTWQEGSRAYPG